MTLSLADIGAVLLAGGVEETLLHPGVESDHKIGLVWGIRDSRVVSDGSWRNAMFCDGYGWDIR